MALISVIVPVYQAVKFIDACVQSVLAQHFSDWELILVNDGSDDGSAERCDDFALNDPRIRVIHQKNSGVSQARNAGIDAAVGKYIAFLDSDDRFVPDMLQKLLRALEGANADSAACAHLIESTSGIRSPQPAALPAGIYDSEQIRSRLVKPLLRDRVEGDKIINGFIVRYLYTASLIKDNNIRFSGAYLEDEVFLIEYFSLAGKLAVIDDALYIYYSNPNSVTRRYLADFSAVFSHALILKKNLVNKFNITGIPDWEFHSCWAGLLMAIANEFAPGNPANYKMRRKNVEIICNSPPFSDAISHFTPANVVGNKKIVVKLIAAKRFRLLSLLYRLKNRNK